MKPCRLIWRAEKYRWIMASVNPEWVNALVGGVIIGIAVSLMLLWHGRVAGISGIIHGLLKAPKDDRAWRLLFISGLVSGGLVANLYNPVVFTNTVSLSPMFLIIAGLLVGFGTALGSGCTSGHGVCGISRLSIRSILATLIFMAAGIATVFVIQKWGVPT
jgi:uncharacterized protein